MKAPVPVVDLFAGPGGLGEGFSCCTREGRPFFRICVSVEKDEYAHRTLTLRSFMRQFTPDQLPDDYYRHLRGEITVDALFEAWPDQAAAAKAHTLERPHEMGIPEDDKSIDTAIRKAVSGAGTDNWILVGGPPCQAYSLSGRSRRARESREEFEKDKRHVLYEEYLRIIRQFKPTAFVMENVKGLLSATLSSRRVLANILGDLSAAGYELYSLSRKLKTADADKDPGAFIVRAEDYGIPQRRHRIFIVGVRNRLQVAPAVLAKCTKQVTVSEAIGDLPRIRSHISRRPSGKGEDATRPPVDTVDTWSEEIRAIRRQWFSDSDWKTVQPFLNGLALDCVDSGEFVKADAWLSGHSDLREWCHDERLGGVVNHAGRSHMASDLRRYFYVAARGRLMGTSPKLDDFPSDLLPDHANVEDDVIPHSDRFKVQLEAKPASTVTCHIARDGHYYIHPDPTQCRSLTVREAARLQTFPDNYFFEGPRTEQYKQVGNAVPPLLARQIAEIVADILA